MLRQDLEQELRRHGNLSQLQQRDSGCVRDSVISVGDNSDTSGLMNFDSFNLQPIYSISECIVHKIIAISV